MKGAKRGRRRYTADDLYKKIRTMKGYALTREDLIEITGWSPWVCDRARKELLADSRLVLVAKRGNGIHANPAVYRVPLIDELPIEGVRAVRRIWLHEYRARLKRKRLAGTDGSKKENNSDE